MARSWGHQIWLSNCRKSQRTQTQEGTHDEQTRERRGCRLTHRDRPKAEEVEGQRATRTEPFAEYDQWCLSDDVQCEEDGNDEAELTVAELERLLETCCAVEGEGTIVSLPPVPSCGLPAVYLICETRTNGGESNIGLVDVANPLGERNEWYDTPYDLP